LVEDTEPTMADFIDVLEAGGHKSEDTALRFREGGTTWEAWISGSFPADEMSGSEDDEYLWAAGRSSMNYLTDDICLCGHLFELHEDNNDEDSDLWLYPCTLCDCTDFEGDN